MRLFIDGIELDTLEPRDSSTEGATPDALWVAVKFEDTDKAKRQVWEQLLRIARRKDRLALSVGPTGGPQWPTTAHMHFNLYPRGFTRFAVILLAVLLVALVVLGLKSNLLRDDNQLRHVSRVQVPRASDVTTPWSSAPGVSAPDTPAP